VCKPVDGATTGCVRDQQDWVYGKLPANQLLYVVTGLTPLLMPMRCGRVVADEQLLTHLARAIIDAYFRA
jgi:hypothetical protein